MNKACLPFALLSCLAFQSGCGAPPEEKAAATKPTASESSKTAGHSEQANAGGHPTKEAMREQGKITLALAPPGDPDRVKAGATLDLVCRVTADPSGPEPELVTFDVSGTRNKKQVSFGSNGVKSFERQDQTFTFTARLKAPERAGSYVVVARVHGVDPTVPGPDPAPAADGTRGKAGARMEFPAPTPLKIKVIGEGPPA
jgi:hypothetical protein